MVDRAVSMGSLDQVASNVTWTTTNFLSWGGDC